MTKQLINKQKSGTLVFQKNKGYSWAICGDRHTSDWYLSVQIYYILIHKASSLVYQAAWMTFSYTELPGNYTHAAWNYKLLASLQYILVFLQGLCSTHAVWEIYFVGLWAYIDPCQIMSNPFVHAKVQGRSILLLNSCYLR